ncbi:RND family efflux transporter MFP subunit [Sinobacterium caligoides]|uniref:RND family efflux transporter MFP subunit n=1 Tax=Sinobacterium caligoides TaxID=933926 RepID=A0A3N2DYK0_9GAMM|nr:efflux RND transporter periplasmic adaptor subunit [Sinobacterium caligoides]ROS04847.1 RND family efflux transporter MFP subunit [Sinobacterium caligoides]
MKPSVYCRCLLLMTLVPALLSGLVGCAGDATDEVQAADYHSVLSYTLRGSEDLELDREFVGLVTPSQNGSIGFELSGKISEILVDEGEEVRQGQALMMLDVSLLHTESRQLEAKRQQAKSDLKLVRANLKRLHSLQEKGYTSTQSVDEQTARESSLLAQLNQLQAGINANQLKIDKSTLKAPFDGVIGRRLVSLGQVVTASMPVYLLSLQQSNEAQIGVPVRMLEQLHSGDDLSVTVADKLFPVQLITKGAVIDPATRTVQLRLALPADSSVISGQLAYLSLPEKIHRSGYWVPLTALTDGLRGLWNVYVLMADADGSSYILEKRDIRVLYATAERAYVTGAIAEGESIVAGGMHRLVPGQQVVIAAPVEPTKKASVDVTLVEQ